MFRQFSNGPQICELPEELARPQFYARVIQVIETTLDLRGKGNDGDPKRRVTQYWTLDGKLLAEVDPCARGVEVTR